MTAEEQRIEENNNKQRNWHLWGPYLAGRQWGTFRENPTDNEFWWGLTHDQSRSTAYRWGEDGILGISDDHQYMCFSVAMWNGKDPILKERLFGLTNPEGNHGEDIKERVFYIEGTPTHSYLHGMYTYPQDEFPYDELIRENARRNLGDPEYELEDTGVLNENKFFQINVEYAKIDENDIVIRLTAINRGHEKADLWLMPTIWFRNTWSWGYPNGPIGDITENPQMTKDEWSQGDIVVCHHPVLGNYNLYAEKARDVIFTNNATNLAKLTGKAPGRFTKDAFHRYLIQNHKGAIDKTKGTKAGLVYEFKDLSPNKEVEILLRLTPAVLSAPFEIARQQLGERRHESNTYFDYLTANVDEETKPIIKQAYAGLVWTKQWYYLDMEQWTNGDPGKLRVTLPSQTNRNWRHMKHDDVMLVPDHWEYPWYAAWDLAFHAVAYADIDLEFAKKQIQILTNSRVMHPNGQIPAYENEFDAVNPPVLGWAAWQLYLQGKCNGNSDRKFLIETFNKFLLNFGWWVNRKDEEGRNVFQGGFLGLDNIGVFDRNMPIPGGGRLDQADGTSWMAQFALVLFLMAVELWQEEDSYEDLARKFLRHYCMIIDASSHLGDQGVNLWEDRDGFFYDVIRKPDGSSQALPVRSIVGLLPMIATTFLNLNKFPKQESLGKLIKEVTRDFPLLLEEGHLISKNDDQEWLFSMVSEGQLKRILEYMLAEHEFLSPYGIRSLSKFHESHPVGVELGGQWFTIEYQPGESKSRMFGGNSNWRGPIWVPVDYLLIESLGEYHKYYGDEWKTMHPSITGSEKNLKEIKSELSKRLINLFKKNEHKKVPALMHSQMPERHYYPDLVWFYEYFHGDSGQGLGASHQTGWTALVARLGRECGK